MDIIGTDANINVVGQDDFNSALDRILDSFRFGVNGEVKIENLDDGEELCVAEKAYDRLSADVREYDAKKHQLQRATSIPKVMKNDIRRHYSRMFMNTLNSADFNMLQDYFSTFMCGPCKLLFTIAAPSELAIPNQMVILGPRLASHFSLGCFVQFPDMVMSMTDSKIVTSNSWAGTKIVMQVQFKATKMYNIDMESWIPQLATLSETYQAAIKEECLKKAIARNDHIDFTEVQIDVPKTDRLAKNPKKEVADLDSIIPIDNWNPHGGLRVNTQRSESGSKCLAPLSRAVSMESTGLQPSTVSRRPIETASIFSATHDGANNSIVVSACASISHSLSGDENQSTSMSFPACDTDVAARAGMDGADKVGLKRRKTADNPEYIPEAWVRSLMARAELLPEPIPMLLQGEIVMFLDETNHIQHMCETLVQVWVIASVIPWLVSLSH